MKNKKKNKRLSLKYKLILFLTIIMFLGQIKETIAEEIVDICIIKSLNIRPYNDALKGFLEALEKEGYKEGENLVLNYYLLDKRIDGTIEKIREEKTDLILTIGTRSTQKVWDAEIKNIPVVFSMVLDPVGKGFVQNIKNPGSNFTGSAMDIIPDVQLSLMKSIVTDVKEVGVVYNPFNTEKIIKKAVLFAKENEIELKKVTVIYPKQVPDAINGLINDIDILWMVLDTKLINKQSLLYILSFTLKNRIPVMGYARHLVKNGALFALDCDYEDIGRQSGELSCEILKGKNASSLPVTFPRKTLLSINIRVSELLGINISDKILKKAHTVFN